MKRIKSKILLAKSKAISKNNNRLLFFTLVIEGGALMAVELLGAKLIGPYYGGSLYVWAAVLAITLLGLATGYYTGGAISKKYPNANTLFAIVTISALLVLIMPFWSKIVMQLTMGLGLKLGVVVSGMFFLMPPLVCFGMVSPMVVRLITEKVNQTGKSAGKVYFISTIGGVVATFWFGFYAIPELGLQMSSFIVGLALLLPGVFFKVFWK